jgi:hypothetical protein
VEYAASDLSNDLVPQGMRKARRTMSNHISLPCAHCLRNLKVRTAYLGQWVTCNHCGNPFVARQVAGTTVPASSAEFASIRTEEAGATSGSFLGPEFARAHPMRGGADVVSTLEAKEADPAVRANGHAGVERLHGQVRALQERVKAVECLEGELVLARGEYARLDATARVLKSELSERVSQVERLRRAAEELAAVKAGRDRLADGRSQATVALDAMQERHRGELQALGLELQEARHREGRANRREAELIGELEALKAELDRQRQAVEQGRHESQKALAVLLRELEAEFRAEAARLREPAAGDPQAVRDELTSLHEGLERLQQERDSAVEQAGRLRLEHDRRQASHALLETRLQEIEERHRAEVERLTFASEDALRRAQVASRREADLAAPIRSVREPADDPRRDPGPVCHESGETFGELHRELEDSLRLSWNREPGCPAVGRPGGPESGRPEIAAAPVPPDSSDGDRTEEAIAATGPPRVDDEGPVPTTPPEDIGELIARDSAARPGRDVGESPEVRIQTLRNHLRIAHEARSVGFINRPFFARLTRIWKNNESA